MFIPVLRIASGMYRILRPIHWLLPRESSSSSQERYIVVGVFPLAFHFHYLRSPTKTSEREGSTVKA